MATTLMLLNAKIATYVGAIAWRWDPVTLVDFVSDDLDGESWSYSGASPITANITIDLDGQVMAQSGPGTYLFELTQNGITIGSVSITTGVVPPAYTFSNKIITVNNVTISNSDTFMVIYPVYDITSLRQITSSFEIYMDDPTPTPTSTQTPTPTVTPTVTPTDPNFYDCSGCVGVGWIPYDTTSCYKIVTSAATAPVSAVPLIRRGAVEYSSLGTQFYDTGYSSGGTGTILETSLTAPLWYNSPNNTVN